MAIYSEGTEWQSSVKRTYALIMFFFLSRFLLKLFRSVFRATFRLPLLTWAPTKPLHSHVSHGRSQQNVRPNILQLIREYSMRPKTFLASPVVTSVEPTFDFWLGCMLRITQNIVCVHRVHNFGCRIFGNSSTRKMNEIGMPQSQHQTMALGTVAAHSAQVSRFKSAHKFKCLPIKCETPLIVRMCLLLPGGFSPTPRQQLMDFECFLLHLVFGDDSLATQLVTLMSRVIQRWHSESAH